METFYTMIHSIKCFHPSITNVGSGEEGDDVGSGKEEDDVVRGKKRICL